MILVRSNEINIASVLSAFTKVAPKKVDDKTRCVQVHKGRILQHSAAITVEVDIPGLPDELAWVNYEKLAKCCRSLSGEIFFSSDGEFVVRDAASEYRLPIHHYPKVHLARGEYATVFRITRKSLNHLASVVFASDDVTADFDDCIMLYGNSNEIGTCAGDSVACSTAWVGGQSGDFSITLPVSSFIGLIECLDAVEVPSVEIGVDQNSIMVSADGFRAVVAASSGRSFRDGARLREVAKSVTPLNIDRSEVLMAIRQAQVVSDRDNDLISVEPRGNQLKISMSSPLGEFETFIKSNAVGERASFRSEKLRLAIKNSTNEGFSASVSGGYFIVRSEGYVAAIGGSVCE